MWKKYAALFTLIAAEATAAGLTPVDPRCDGMVNPLGVDATPRFSWKLRAADGVRGARQAAWQLRVGAWDSGLGQYQLSLDGRSPGNDLLTPGWTDYSKSVLYDTYDVANCLRNGPHTLGLELASGMYGVQPGRYTKFTTPYRPLKAIALLRLEHADGAVDTVATGSRWQVAAGPTTFANVFGGEDFDARLTPANWEPAVETAGPGGELRGASHASPPFRIFETLPPNTTGAVSLLAGDVADVREGGQPAATAPGVRFLRLETDRAIFAVDSGHYEFSTP